MVKRILVVEDDPDALEAFCEALRLSGFECVGARTGLEGLGALGADPAIDAILLDLMMPKLDGWQFRKLQLASPALARIPIVVVSALTVAQKSAATFGAAAFFAKPVDPQEVVAAFRGLDSATKEPDAPAAVAPRREIPTVN